MKKRKHIYQGDIYMASLDGVDSEQKNARPVIIISANIRNETSPNVFIFPITHANKKKQPCHYTLDKDKYPFFIYNKNIILCEEGRSISKKRLERFLGQIEEEDVLEILKIKEYIFIEKNS